VVPGTSIGSPDLKLKKRSVGAARRSHHAPHTPVQLKVGPRGAARALHRGARARVTATRRTSALQTDSLSPATANFSTGTGTFRIVRNGFGDPAAAVGLARAHAAPARLPFASRSRPTPLVPFAGARRFSARAQARGSSDVERSLSRAKATAPANRDEPRAAPSSARPLDSRARVGGRAAPRGVTTRTGVGAWVAKTVRNEDRSRRAAFASRRERATPSLWAAWMISPTRARSRFMR
jgi:hypothetical protein